MPKIICPSGLAGEIRELKTKEANLIARNFGTSAGATIQDVVAACWTKTLDPGPYKLPASGVLDWQDVLFGDVLYALLRIRALTFGEDYEFTVQCTNRPGCQERIKHTVVLDKVKVIPFPAASRAAFAAGNRLETMLDDKKIVFKLVTGREQEKTKNVRKAHRDQAVSVALTLRIESIEGVDNGDKKRWIEDLGLLKTWTLQERMDEAEGGVETTIEITCPECFTIQEIELPLAGIFTLPKRSRAPQTDETDATS